MEPQQQPIIVIKKKGSHGGHHGGAWKVAYADFVTAMMSLFIVLWLMSSTSKQTQEVIAGYFNDPKGTATKKGSEGKPVPKDIKESKNKEELVALKEQLLKTIQNIDVLNKLKKQIEITVTEEGLRIELIENEKGTFFQSGSAQPTPALAEILKVLAGQLKTLPNSISIEGHTDAQPYVTSATYSNWELSADRANVARREMQVDGIRKDQVSQVRGFADQRLYVPKKPLDAANRRVSVVVQNLPQTQPAKANLKEASAKPETGPDHAAAVSPAEHPATAAASTVPAPSAPAFDSTAKESAAAVAADTVPAKSSLSLIARAKGLFGKH